MKILVTGAAGFIGSHLCEYLIAQEHTVVGIDAMTASYEPRMKERNISSLKDHSRFTFYQQNLLTVDWTKLLEDVDIIYHLAGVPGVRTSWGSQFNDYVQNNILVTQRLLEACKYHPLTKFIYISTSSIYGEKNGRVTEGLLPEPLSPYGLTKLAGEHLCEVYYKSYNVPVVILRYFTVYGPRQRPDMAFHRFIKQIIRNEPITIYGDGTQSRDFTYISDCIKGTASVLHSDTCIGEIINIGGKERATVLDVIEIIEQLANKKAKLNFLPPAKGEPRQTWADITKAEHFLSYAPTVSLKEGLLKEMESLKPLYEEE
mgnify:CR=1 FL=1